MSLLELINKEYKPVDGVSEDQISRYRNVIYNKVNTLKPRSLLECGVSYGESTVMLLAYCKENDLVLLSCDIDYPAKVLIDFIQKYNLNNNWCFVKQDDLIFGEWLKAAGASFDYIFVDTSHQYEESKKELELLWLLTRSGGTMMWDDYSYSGEDRAIQEWLKQTGVSHEHIPRDFLVVRKP